MAQIRPFNALRYSPERVPVDRVVTQPYDKISPEMQEEYRARHPHNLVRILRPASEPDLQPGVSPYKTAASLFSRWRDQGVIEQLSEPSLFAYFQRFRTPDSELLRTRKGFIGLTRLEDYADKVIFPHERTLTGPKLDRLELLRETRTHFGQVFLLYSDTLQAVDAVLDPIAAVPAEISVRDEYDVEHLLWRIADRSTIEVIQRAMSDQRLVIADGHHRYETALAFRDEKRKELATRDAGPFEWLMTTLVNMDSPGMTILPTHRVISNLGSFDAGAFTDRAREYFAVSKVKDLEALERRLESADPDQPTLGLVADRGRTFLVLELRPDLDRSVALPDVSPAQARLDVVVLHRLALERCLNITEEDVRGESYLRYVRGAELAVGEVLAGNAQACFLLNATRLDQVKDIAFRGEVLPQKSTDFFPKLLSGLTMYSMG